LKRWGPLGVALAFVLGKLKLILPLVKFAKLGTLVTMVLALWVYAQIWGFAFALGFILLIFVHEMGHALVMRQQGIPAGAPVFIPFVGAVIAMKEMPKNGYVESLVALGGPALGTVGAIVCLLVGAATGSLFWYALASTGFLINLFNMIPLSPLDGGRIVGVISRWIWAVGYAVGIAVFLVTHSPILFLILLLGLFGLGRTLRGPRPGYYDVPPAARRFISFAYFGLLVIMVLGMWTADRPLAALHAIR
jgi:Zn-dependent protease